jgi:hypothetical protein
MLGQLHMSGWVVFFLLMYITQQLIIQSALVDCSKTFQNQDYKCVLRLHALLQLGN